MCQDTEHPSAADAWGIDETGPSDSEMGFEPQVLAGVNWLDDNLFYTHVWRDETSQFDRHPSVRWNGGSETYTREFKARVPIAFRDCRELVEQFLRMMEDNFPDTDGFWVD